MLTDKEKEIALECARKGDLCVEEGLLVVSRGDVLDMFEDFLSRIRDEQNKSYVNAVPDHCDRSVWKGRYYHLNNMAPDCSELVEALESAKLWIQGDPWRTSSDEDERASWKDKYDFINKALANHAKRMKGEE